METQFWIYIIYALAILLMVVAILIESVVMLPLQFYEARVTNGLARLRKQLLIKGIALVIVNLLALLFASWAVTHFDELMNPLYTGIFLLVNSLGFFSIAIIDYRIYHQNYNGQPTIKRDIEEVKKDVKEIKGDVKDVKRNM